MHFLLPCMLAVYLGIILQGYSVKEFNGLVTNRYFLLGKEGPKEGGREEEGGKGEGGDTCPQSHSSYPPSLPPSLLA